jgi:hypothetical protein
LREELRQIEMAEAAEEQRHKKIEADWIELDRHKQVERGA